MPIGPIFKLRYFGRICPCLESEGDNIARGALRSIEGSVSSLPVRWHRKLKSQPSSSSSSSSNENASSSSTFSGLVSGLFGGGGKSNEESTPTWNWTKVDAVFSVIDSESGPAICLEQLLTMEEQQQQQQQQQQQEQDENSKPKNAKRIIPLRRIGEIVPSDSTLLGSLASIMGSRCGVVLYGRGGQDDDGGDEILRFDILEGDADDDNNNKKNRNGVKGERRDDFVDGMTTLLEWDRQRRSAAGEVDVDDEEEEEEEEEEVEVKSSGRKMRTGLGGRAAKAAHFARREIEMKKQKRERENKKARYLKDSGGLKYTAVAMANRATE